MKDLVKAKELYEKIVSIDSEILKLEKLFDTMVNTKTGGEIVVKYDTNKREPLKMDSDGSLISGNGGVYTFIFGSGGSSTPEKHNAKDSFDVSDSELIVVVGSLLRYKQDYRTVLIDDFNKLSIKLKI